MKTIKILMRGFLTNYALPEESHEDIEVNWGTNHIEIITTDGDKIEKGYLSSKDVVAITVE